MKLRTCALSVLFSILILPALTIAETGWKRPPEAVLEVLHAPDLPLAWPNPTGDILVLAQPLRYPPIADLAQPMLKLAGVRINPANNGMHADNSFVELTLKRVADGAETKIGLPADARVTRFLWSADGRRFAFLNRTA